MFVKWQHADMDDLGAAIEQAWDFEDPAGSEARLRALLTDADGQDALVLRTQVARALGLQQRYDEAQAVLDEVAAAGPAPRRGSASGSSGAACCARAATRTGPDRSSPRRPRSPAGSFPACGSTRCT